MKLSSITLENYRVHKSLTVTFDDHRNLIGGPNETGKSTLVEAAHRALFLRYKTGGEVQKQMVSTTGTGHPKVTLEFSIGKNSYTIEKEFRGQNGSALLSSRKGDTWLNDEAENKLRELLQVVDYGAGSAFREQWAHLWVTQGSSGDDPSQQASNHADELLHRLEVEGAGALQQSAQDRKVAEHFSDQYAIHYTATGRLRANSPLENAEKAVQVANQKLSEAEGMLQSLDASRRTFLTADTSLKELLPKVETYTTKMTALGKGLSAAKICRENLDRKAEALNPLEERHRELGKKDREIKALEKEIKSLDQLHATFDTDTKTVTARVESARTSLTNHDTHSLRKPLAEARAFVDFCKQEVVTLEKLDEEKHLAERRDKLLPLQEEIEKQRGSLASFPELLEKDVSDLFQLQNLLNSTREQLNSISTRIEIKSPHKVYTGEGEEVGEALTITGQTELRLGDSANPTVVRVIPGGSEGLFETGERVGQLEDELDGKLRQLGFQSPLAAQEARTKREFVETKLESLEREALSIGGEDLLNRYKETSEKVAQHRKLLASLRNTLKSAPSPNTELAKARDQSEKAHSELEGLVKKDERIHLQYNESKEALHIAERTLKDHREKAEEHGRKRLTLLAKFETLADEYGDDKLRIEKLNQGEKDLEKVEKEIKHLSQQLDEINPSEMEREKDRLRRALEVTQTSIAEAETQKAVARDQLSKVTDRDPVELLAEAKAAGNQAEIEHCRISSQAKAHHLLHGLFQKEKKELADKLTAPLSERVTNYLRPIFGNEVAVSLECGDDNTFQSLALARNGTRFEFSSLSGGTREQVAAAFRLALAEILAEDYDGSLPLVFDDAFTNSDPGRVEQLQCMLDIAAERGLQLIVLSCSPNRYSSLGAKQTMLGQPN